MSISVCEFFSVLSAGVKGIVGVSQSTGDSDVARMSVTQTIKMMLNLAKLKFYDSKII